MSIDYIKRHDPRSEATIRALFLQPIASELRASGLSSASLFRQHGFHNALLNTPYERVSLRRYIALTEYLAKRIGRPNLLFELGQKFDLSDLGPLSTLFMSSATLRSALDYYVRFFSAWQTDTELEIKTQGAFTRFSYVLRDPTIWPRGQDAEFFLASTINLVRSLNSQTWNPVEVGFEHPIGNRQARFKAHFRCPLRECGSSNYIVFRNEDLDRPRMVLDDSSRRVVRRAQQHLVELLDPGDCDEQPLLDRIAGLITRRLGCSSFGIAEIAAELNMSERTLRRRLVELGTSYREILEEQRMLRARQLLGTGSLSLIALAEVLGYSDAAVFSRAFKRWSGAAPGAYRYRGSSADALPETPGVAEATPFARSCGRAVTAVARLPRENEPHPGDLEMEIDRLRHEITELRIERDRLLQAAWLDGASPPWPAT